MIIVNLFLIIIYLINTYRIIKDNNQYYFIFIYLGVLQLWYLISNLYLNFGGFELKLGIGTSENFSLVALFFVYIIFNNFLNYYLKNNKIKYYTSLIPSEFSLSIVFIYLLFLLVPLTFTGIPIFQSLNRAEYFARIEDSPLSIFYRYHYYFPLICGAILNYSSDINIKRKLIYFSLSIYVVFLYSVGNKFTSLFIALIFLLWSYDIVNIYKLFQSRSYKLRLSVVALIVSLIFFISIYTQVARYYEPEVFVSDYLIPRVLESQSALWWASWNEALNTDIDVLSGFKREVTNILSRFGDEYKVGHFFLMLRHGGYKAYLFSQTGFVYTGGYPAILLYIMPIPLIFIFQIPLAFIFAQIITQIKRRVVSNDFLGLFILTQIFMSFVSMFWMGNLHYFFSRRNLFLIIILIIYTFFQNQRTVTNKST